jgi:ergothioneine biosynthesis protein EgtB
MNPVNALQTRPEIAVRFRHTRRRTLALCEPLTAEDTMVEPTPRALSAKSRLGHTAWLFEAQVLREFLPGYRLFNPRFVPLFDGRPSAAAALSRPSLEEVLRYRGYVDAAIEELLERNPGPRALRQIERAVDREEQQQELLLAGVLDAFFANPLRPVYLDELDQTQLQVEPAGELRFKEFSGGLREIGFDSDGFCRENEQPSHRVWLNSCALARRLVTCGEFAAFIADGGYLRSELWLAAGWQAAQANGWRAPLYWTGTESGWSIFTLRGELSLAALESVPVSHVSFFEADAYARWAGCRLPTEIEWENAACGQKVQGNLLDAERFLPAPAEELLDEEAPLQQLFGDCWEWTASMCFPYPGFKPRGSDEFTRQMSGQMVLRGGSCWTPRAHLRATYRGFLAPETRGQCSGIRLARL